LGLFKTSTKIEKTRRKISIIERTQLLRITVRSRDIGPTKINERLKKTLMMERGEGEPLDRPAKAILKEKRKDQNKSGQGAIYGLRIGLRENNSASNNLTNACP